MERKERWLKLQESLQNEPVKQFARLTLRTGWHFFWRQLFLLGPVYLAAFYAEFHAEVLSGSFAALIVPAMIPCIFYGFAAAEDWRRRGILLPLPPVRAGVRTGFSLWWRMLLGWIRWIIPVAALLFVGSLMVRSEWFINVLAFLLWLGGSIPITGLAVLLWNRALAIDGAEAGAAGGKAPPRERKEVKRLFPVFATVYTAVLIGVMAVIIYPDVSRSLRAHRYIMHIEDIPADEYVPEDIVPPMAYDVDSLQVPEAIEEEQAVFVPYDEAPEPVGGYGAIAEQVIYPRLAEAAGIEGQVFVQAKVEADGSVEKVTILRSLGGGCDEAAAAAVKAVRWKPARFRDQPVAVWITVPVRFRLER